MAHVEDAKATKVEPEATQPTNEEEGTKKQTIQATKKPRKRRQTSEAWKHFTRLPLSETKGEPRANCNYCPADYKCDSSGTGTISLLRHMLECKKKSK